MKQSNHSKYISFRFFISILSILMFGHIGFAQTERSPDRTFQAGNSFAVSDIESVNLTNGNVLVNLPLASLPKGRGTSPGYSISLQYNSKLWNARKEYREDGTADETGSRKYTRDLLEYAADGGWHFKADYKLKVTDRQALSDREECSAQNADYAKNGYRWQVEIEFPGGGGKAFRPFGGGAYYEDHFKDGFFEIDPNGKAVVEHLTSNPSLNCTSTPITVTTSGMSYYSTDGSGVRLFIPYLAGAQPNTPNRTWIMSFPDGTTIENLPPDETSVTQRTIDRNGNRIVLKGGTFNNLQGTKIEDSVGRFIFLATTEDGDSKIFQTGFNGAVLETTVEWKQYWVYRNYKATDALNAAASKRREDALLTSVWVDKITLPSQASSLTYEFGYGGATGTLPTFQDYTAGWGELTSVKLPSGAEADYHYDLPENESVLTNSFHILNNSITRKDLKYDQTYDGQTTPAIDTWTYNIGSGSASVTAPNGNITGQSAYPQDNTRFGGLVYGVTNSDGSVVERIWAQNGATQNAPGQAINPYVKTEFTTISNSAGQKTLTAIKDYVYDQNMNVLEVREYDWVSYGAAHPGQGVLTIPGGAVLKRKTVNAYYNPTPEMSSSTIGTNHYADPAAPKLLNLIKSTEIQDGNGAAVSRSEFIYDNAPTAPTKGNLTEARTWDSTKAATLGSADSNGFKLISGNYIAAQTSYDQYGNPLTITNAKGVTSTITYGAVNGYTGLYPTQTETASNYSSLKRTSAATYDFYTGLITSSTDVDNNVTNVTEYDALGRPTKAKAAVGSLLEIWTQTAYDDINRMVIVKSDVETKGDARKVGTQFYDQLGRVRLSKTLENAAAQSATNETDGIKVQTRYATSGSDTYQLISNPYRAATATAATNEPTIGWTRSKSINTGKHFETETFAGASLPQPFVNSGYNTNSTGKVQTDIDADRTLVTDQAGKQRVSKTNALGQLLNIWEITAADSATEAVTFGTLNLNGYKTSYQYDTLNNLTTVNQGSQSRNFTYSSLSRLKSADNPESGVINYTYDNNGNLITKTDARSVTTAFTYDVLNRVTLRDYSDSTLDVTYTYDALPNAKGKLIKVENSLSKTEYQSFDILGRVVQSQQTTDGAAYPEMTYTYNLSGAIIEQKYPSGRVVKNVVDNDGDLSIVQSKKNQTAGFWNYADNFTYTAAGTVTSVQLGNGRWESTVFNSRLQSTQIALGTVQNGTDKLKLNFDYGTTANNSNVLSQMITVPAEVRNSTTYNGFTATHTYTYDSLNRLKAAEETIPSQTGWKQTFEYDRFGNRTFNEANTTASLNFPKQCSGAMCAADKKIFNPQAQTSNNRFSTADGCQYDSAGNTTRNAENRKFTYDGENHQTKIETVDSNGIVTGTLGEYFYDGDGKRVKKYVPSTEEITVFIYDASGKLVAENSTLPAPIQAVSYLTTNNIGSPRITTDSNGQVISRRDFQPFGEEILRASYGSDNIKQKFTSYERDNESELDFAQARYYANKLGRFTSVDMGPFTPADPQNFNRYIYVQNNPIKFRDPSGNKIELTGDESQAFIDYLEKKTGLKLKYTTKNGVTTITGSSKDKNFTGTVNKEFADVLKKVAGATDVAKFNVDSSLAKNGNDKGDIVFFDDNGNAWNAQTIDKSGNKVIRPGNVNMTSINSVDGQDTDFAQALVGHFLIEGLEMRQRGSNYDLGTEGAHQSGLDVEKKILGQKDKRYQEEVQGQTNTYSFVYTTVQYDVSIKSDGSAAVKKISPPTVKRPKK